MVGNKLHGCGNSFLVVDEEKKGEVPDKISYVIERAKTENVDGILFLRRSNGNADLEMRVFDRDGTEEAMCGNGLRCLVKYAYDNGYIGISANILTGDGIKRAEIKKDMVSVMMGQPRQFMHIEPSHYFIFTGVPHIICFVDELCLEEAFCRGREMRHDKKLCNLVGYEKGVCVNFVKVNSKNRISIMTYEVGVEAVTKACGTGSAGAAYVASIARQCLFPIIVHNRGGDITVDCAGSELIMVGKAEYM